MSSLAALDNFSVNSLLFRILVIAFASAPTSLTGTNRPFLPSRITSFVPSMFVATIGNSDAIASKITFGRPSDKLGSTNILAAPYQLYISSGDLEPAKIISSLTFNSFDKFFISFSKIPEPIITNCGAAFDSNCINDGNLENARIIVSGSFRGMSQPTNKIVFLSGRFNFFRYFFLSLNFVLKSLVSIPLGTVSIGFVTSSLIGFT